MSFSKRFVVSFFLSSLLVCLFGTADAFSFIPREAFNEMYQLAAKGDVIGLKNQSRWGNFVDSVNSNGDTGLCVAAKRRDKLAFKTFVKAGADMDAACTLKIKDYKEFANSAMRYTPPVPVTKTSVATSTVNTGLISGTTLAWTAGGLAVAGGVAVAAGGGGGGGGGCSGFVGDDGGCYDKLECEHGHQDKDKCVCDEGWEGDLCDKAKDCPGYAEDGHCGADWQDKTKTCMEGVTITYECKTRTNTTGCASFAPYADRCLSCNGGYDFDAASGTCTAKKCKGYATEGGCNITSEWQNMTDACQAGEIKKYKCVTREHTEHCKTFVVKEDKCASCDEGWTGDTCSTAATCTGYKPSCIINTEYRVAGDTCKTGDDTYVKCEAREHTTHCATFNETSDTCASCDEGWTGDTCEVPEECEGYKASCTIDTEYRVENDTCKAGDETYVKCEAREHTAHCETFVETEDKCASCDEGWTGDTCQTPATCPSDYKALNGCDNGYWNNTSSASCPTGGTTLYQCIQSTPDARCDVYKKDSDGCQTCESGWIPNSSGVCVENECEGYATEGGCNITSEWQNMSNECQAGEVTEYKCVTRTNTTGCASFAPYADRCLSCNGGYDFDAASGTCTAKKCEGYATEGGCTVLTEWQNMNDKCTSGETDKYKCVTREHTEHCETFVETEDKCASCTPAWEGDTCEDCPSGQIEGDTCYEALSCVHGHQDKDKCVCQFGWKGELCDTEAYNNYNVNETINKQETAPTADVIGLEYVSGGDKAGPDQTALYNGYVESVKTSPTDTTPEIIDKTFSITVKATDSADNVNLYGLKNESGPAYGVFANGAEKPIEGILNSEIDVSYERNTYDGERTNSLYGIYANGDAVSRKKENANGLSIDSQINLVFEDKYEYQSHTTYDNQKTYLYGLYSVLGNVLNAADSSIKVTATLLNPPSNGWASDDVIPETYIYGVRVSQGQAQNDGSIVIQADQFKGFVCGIYTGSGNATNTDTVEASSSGTAYGIYAAIGSVDNTNGTVTASSSDSSSAYGIYVKTGSIDLSKLGTVTATATDGTAVAVKAEKGTLNLTDANTANLTASGTTRYLFELTDAESIIYNAATIGAGLKAGYVNNTGTIGGGTCGIYALTSATNSGTVTASSSSSYVYGIYAASGDVDNTKGTVTASSSSSYVYGIYAASGDVDNTKGTVTASSSSSSYYVFGIYAKKGDVDNTNGMVKIENSIADRSYGIYAESGSVDNTNGTVKVSAYTAYGIYVKTGSIDLSKLGTVTATAISSGDKAVAVWAKTGTLDLTDANTANLTASGTTRYLFELTDAASVINNAATIDAGLKAGTVNNTGTINGGRYGIYALTSATNSGTVTATSSGAYGIYAESGDVDNSGGTVETTASPSASDVYGIYARSGNVNNTNGKVKANIHNISYDKPAAYGIYAKSGSVDNTYGTVEASGTSDTSAYTDAYGIYAENDNVDNSGGTVIASSSRSAYGIYIQNGTVGNPSGTVTASSSSSYVYGIYAQRSVVFNTGGGEVHANRTSGSRPVYGVYLDGSTLYNHGLIHIDLNAEDTTSYGVYAINSSTVYNSGIIRRTINGGDLVLCLGINCYTGAKDNPPFIYLDETSTYHNESLMMSSAPMNFNEDFGQGNVMLAQGGAFEAPELAGDLGVESDVVSEGFEESYTLSDAIISDNVDDLNLYSQSVMFDAALEGQDVVLNKKDFDDVLGDSSMAAFLEENYAMGQNEDLFSLIKSQTTEAALNGAVKDLMGDGLKRFAFEDMTMIKELGIEMNNAMFNNTKSTFEITGTTSPLNFEKNVGSSSRWALSANDNGKTSFGIGMALTKINSQDSSRENTRKDEMFQMMMPMGYRYQGFEFVTMPRVGYAYGHYTREGVENMSYDGKIEKRIFGVTNAARYPIKKEGLTIAPTAEFNAIGYHIKGHEEDKQYAINIDKQNIFSAEAGFGLSGVYEKEFTNKGKLKINASAMLYHEFADPYELKLSMKDTQGSWQIRDERRKDDHVVIKGGFEYDFKPFSIYGNVFSYIDSEYRTKADIGLKYAF